MRSAARYANHPGVVWSLFAAPSMPMIAALAWTNTSAGDLLHVSGEFAARFMIAAMAVTPLRLLLPRSRWVLWMMRHRRALGVAAFGYTSLHALLYVIDLETLRNIMAEFWALGIWTGWFAAAIMLPLALTSNDAAVRVLRQGWRRVHWLVYPAAVLTLVHWMFVDNDIGPALAHFIPLAFLEMYRLTRAFAARRAGTSAS